MIRNQFIIAFLLLIMCYSAFAREEGVLSEEVSDGFTFESSAIGASKKWRVDGDNACFLLNGDIEINGVRAEVFGKDEEHYFLFTDKARVSRDFKYVISDSHVRIVRGDAEITGTGLEWNSDKSIAVIKKNVRVIFKHEKGQEFLK